jgi:hypothetical protein
MRPSGLGLGGDPVGGFGHELIPIPGDVGEDGDGKRVALAAFFGDRLDEGVSAGVRPTGAHAGNEREILEAALQEVFRAESSDGGVVHVDEGKFEIVFIGEDIDDGGAGPHGHGGDFGGGEASDDAVALPAVEPFGKALVVVNAFSGVEVERPGSAFADVACDPGEDIAANAGVGFDEHGDARRLERGLWGLG